MQQTKRRTIVAHEAENGRRPTGKTLSAIGRYANGALRAAVQRYAELQLRHYFESQGIVDSTLGEDGVSLCRAVGDVIQGEGFDPSSLTDHQKKAIESDYRRHQKRRWWEKNVSELEQSEKARRQKMYEKQKMRRLQTLDAGLATAERGLEVKVENPYIDQHKTCTSAGQIVEGTGWQGGVRLFRFKHYVK